MYTMQSLGNYGYHSFQGSLMSPYELVELAYQQGFRAVGMADLGGFWGAVEFSKACARLDLRPIFACRIVLSEIGEVQLTVRNRDGYRVLSRYLTHWQRQGNVIPIFEFQYFWREFGGHFHLSIRPTPIRKVSPHVSDWVGWKQRWELGIEFLGPEFWIELQWNTTREQELQRRVYQELQSLTDQWVIMSGARYATSDQWRMLRILQSIKTGTRLNQSHPNKLVPGDYSFLSAEALRHRFYRVPRVLDQTRFFVDSCEFDFELERPSVVPAGYRLYADTERINEPFTVAEGASYYGHKPLESVGDDKHFRRLRYLCLRGIVLRYGKAQTGLLRKPLRGAVLERLEFELAAICGAGQIAYFLSLRELVLTCQSRGLSIAGFCGLSQGLVCYALEVSDVCPFRFAFRGEEIRNVTKYDYSKPGDVHLCIPADRRDELIQVVHRVFGADRVAGIGGICRFDRKRSIHEVATALGRRGALTEKSSSADVFKIALRIEDLPLQPIVHSDSVVVADKPIVDFSPLIFFERSLGVTQLSKQAIVDLGLNGLEFSKDSLLCAIRDACDNVREETGTISPLGEIDFEDKQIYEWLNSRWERGVGWGVSPDVLSLVKACHCKDIDCFIDLLSIAPLLGVKLTDKIQFVNRIEDAVKARSLDCDLELILGDSLGFIVYEEQLMGITNRWAGMELRSAQRLCYLLVGKRRGRELKEFREDFFISAINRDIDKRSIQEIWKQLVGYSGAFRNRLHAAAYAVRLLQSVYLSKYYTVYFLAAMLQYKLRHSNPLSEVLEILHNGCRFELPDVNCPFPRYRVVGNMVFVPVVCVAGLSRGFVDVWEMEIRKGKFSDWSDFLSRVNPDRADLLLLAKTGALRFFFKNRDEAIHNATTHKRQGYEESDKSTPNPQSMEATASVSDSCQRALLEAELLGFPVSMSPYDFYLNSVDRSHTIEIRRLRDFVGREVEIVGILIGFHHQGSSSSVSIADETGAEKITLDSHMSETVERVSEKFPVIRVRVFVEWNQIEESRTVKALSIRRVRVNPVETVEVCGPKSLNKCDV
jgi:DNA polymerase III alpha subunit